MYSKYCERFVDIMGVKPAGSRKEYFDAWSGINSPIREDKNDWWEN
jgi:hypothetical protein